jgi:hypothetical protein
MSNDTSSSKNQIYHFPKIMFPHLDETEEEFEIRFLRELLTVCEKSYMRLQLYQKVCEKNTMVKETFL